MAARDNLGRQFTVKEPMQAPLLSDEEAERLQAREDELSDLTQMMRSPYGSGAIKIHRIG